MGTLAIAYPANRPLIMTRLVHGIITLLILLTVEYYVIYVII